MEQPKWTFGVAPLPEVVDLAHELRELTSVVLALETASDELRALTEHMIKVKGATVYPSEVETALLTVPGVARALVVDLPRDSHVDLGAVVVLTSDASLTDVDLAREAKARLSAFKVPTHWAVVARDEIPVTATGKVDKAALQELLERGN